MYWIKKKTTVCLFILLKGFGERWHGVYKVYQVLATATLLVRLLFYFSLGNIEFHLTLSSCHHV